MAAVSILRDDRSSEIPFLNRLLDGRALTTCDRDPARARRLRRRRPGSSLLIVLALAVLGLVLGQRFGLRRRAALARARRCFLPLLWLKREAGASARAAFEAQLPEALDMLVNALQAGYSLQAAMEFVGREMPEPLGPEFVRFYDEQRLGMEVRMALLRFQERVGTIDARMFVTSLLIQRETGGNLGEVLTNLATLMRERVTFRVQLATLTAEPQDVGAGAGLAAARRRAADQRRSTGRSCEPLFTTPIGPQAAHLRRVLGRSSGTS